MTFEIRRLIRGDELIYRHIHLESLRIFPDNFGTLYEDQRKVERLPFEEFVRDGSADNFVYGAFIGEKLVGITGFRRETRPKTRHRGEVVQMFVHPDAQGRGVGESLLRAVVEAAFALPEIDSVELSAVAENEAARKLYERVGFKTYGVRSRYFRSGERYWDQRFMELFKSEYASSNP